jgi:hypothetical protein
MEKQKKLKRARKKTKVLGHETPKNEMAKQKKTKAGKKKN